ncbi:Hypothetical protein NTJ_15093 [Nesidiocoris tenuis]|uniref:Uncharacterized protein n=1 Tax=Nesidiocoris tenuis TaxID=355587 RepID=A0ABN7BEJ7_9HEMI|nr:Hypothetical protein NTJ_15093 [Nesidiocoris tenuis]
MRITNLSNESHPNNKEAVVSCACALERAGSSVKKEPSLEKDRQLATDRRISSARTVLSHGRMFLVA